MHSSTFQTTAHAKCILAGEHAVLQGCPAVVLPVFNRSLTLRYEDSDSPVEVECDSPYTDTFLMFFWNTLESGLSLVKKRLSDVHGKFIIENNIPMGAGIGFSSALCVAITRWLVWEHFLKEDKFFKFAQHLENMFHGKSSGLDIAGAMSDHIIHFEKSGIMHEVKTHWQPQLYLSYSGHIKNTAEAVNHVNMIRKKYPGLAKMIDKEMSISVKLIEKSLKMAPKNGFRLLINAINHAYHCFKVWGLITPALQQHIDLLHQLGATVAKPTGAGIGGYVLSLWEKEPPKDSPIELISVFDVNADQLHLHKS